MLFRSDRKSTRLNSSHLVISYAVFCLKKKKKTTTRHKPDVQSPHIAQHTNTTATSPLIPFVLDSANRPLCVSSMSGFFFFFFFNDPATPEISPLPLHDPLPILAQDLEREKAPRRPPPQKGAKEERSNK